MAGDGMLGAMEVAGLPTSTAEGSAAGANAAQDVASDGLRVITVEPALPETIDFRELSRPSRIVWWLGRHAALVTAVLCSVVAVVGFRGGDYPAQDYRAFMFGAHGFLIWDVNWYGGHALLGYSVLFPAVGWALGTVPATALACTMSTALFGRLIGRADNWPAVVARLWFAVFVVGDLIVGRAPFACATTAGLVAVLAIRARHAWLGAAAAVVASLFSPLGAAFLLVGRGRVGSEPGLAPRRAVRWSIRRARHHVSCWGRRHLPVSGLGVRRPAGDRRDRSDRCAGARAGCAAHAVDLRRDVCGSLFRAEPRRREHHAAGRHCDRTRCRVRATAGESEARAHACCGAAADLPTVACHRRDLISRWRSVD